MRSRKLASIIKRLRPKKLVSIIVSIFEVEDVIEESLNSIREQTYTNIEIICVNGLSMDNSATVVKGVMQIDPRIKLINQLENSGLGGRWNKGLQHASGTYVQFVDGNDRIAPTFVEELVDALEQTGADYSFCALSYFSDRSSIPTRLEEPFYTAGSRLLARKGLMNLVAEPDVLVEIYPFSPIVMYRRFQILQLKASFVEYQSEEDHQFYYTMGFNSKSAIYVPKHLYEIRRDANRLSVNFSNRIGEFFDKIEKNEGAFKKHLPDDAFYRSTIKMSIRLLSEQFDSMGADKTNREVLINRSAELLNKFPRAALELFKDVAVSKENLAVLIGEAPFDYSAVSDTALSALRARISMETGFNGEPIMLTDCERRQLALTMPDWSIKGSSPWADVEVHFDQPLDLSSCFIRSIVVVDCPVEVSLRFALFCQPMFVATRQEELIDDAHIFEFRCSVRAGANIVYFAPWSCTILRGRPDPSRVRKILLGGPANDAIFGATLTMLDGVMAIDLLSMSSDRPVAPTTQ